MLLETVWPHHKHLLVQQDQHCHSILHFEDVSKGSPYTSDVEAIKIRALFFKAIFNIFSVPKDPTLRVSNGIFK